MHTEEWELTGLTRRGLLQTGAAALALAGAGVAVPALAQDAAPAGADSRGWRKLATVPFAGKQDDISFVTPDLGWYGNGQGKLYRTDDGGGTWTQVLDKPGTFVRALGFVDAKVGFLGNLGTERFKGVTDTTPLYRTTDGGSTWDPVAIASGPAVPGICAIDILRHPHIDRGELAHRIQIRAAGRVGGPAFLIQSLDGGDSFQSVDLNAVTGAILDIHFLTPEVGFIAGASSPNVQAARGRILKTVDGGRTWRTVFEGSRPFEITWKMSFPTADIGYVTLQSYNPDPTTSRRYVLKTVDGGETWQEVPLIDDHGFRAFGIAFADADRGWIGGVQGGLETLDGGATWQPVAFGRAVNKIRVVTAGKVRRAFAIGAEVHRLDLSA